MLLESIVQLLDLEPKQTLGRKVQVRVRLPVRFAGHLNGIVDRTGEQQGADGRIGLNAGQGQNIVGVEQKNGHGGPLAGRLGERN